MKLFNPVLPAGQARIRATPVTLIRTVRRACQSVAAAAVASLSFAALMPSTTVASTLVNWGDNSWGQLVGTPFGEFIALAAGDRHTIAIRDDGTLAAWGTDYYGETTALPAGTFVGVAAGRYNNVAIRSDGTLASWGYDSYGQVSGTPAGTFKAVTSGSFFGIGIRTDGTLATWGAPYLGIDVNTPAGVFKAVAGGWDHAVAIREDGTLVAWGDDSYGQVSQTPSGTFQAVAAGTHFSVALRTDGTLASWGTDWFGEVSGTPSGRFSAVAAKWNQGLALRADGTLASWGNSGPVPLGTFSAIAAGASHGAAIQVGAPPNQPPAARCQDVTVFATDDCVANASVDNGSSDPDPNDAITVDQSPAGPYPLGQTLVTLTVTDSHGASSSCQATVTVVDGTAPEIVSPQNVSATAASASGAVVNFATPTASDHCTGVNVVCNPPSGSLFPPGVTTVVGTATDGAGNTAQCAFNVVVNYQWSGALQPINADGSSVFKAGSTVAVKFQLTGASAGITTASARLTYAKVSNSVPGPVNEADASGNATTGNLFQYDPTSGQYRFNWSTRGLTAGSYRLTIDLGDGVVRTVNVALR